MSAAEIMDIITITGDIGSGKSVVGRALSTRLGFDFFSTGFMQRTIAERRGMSTLQLNAHSEGDPGVDHEIDHYSVELGRTQDRFVLDSRLAWHFIPHSFKVYLAVDSLVAAERIFADKGRRGESYATVAQAHQAIVDRRKSELSRFESLYHLDCGDLGHFDLVINTANLTPEAVADQIAGAFEQWKTRAAQG